jgi:hypothetical protein
MYDFSVTTKQLFSVGQRIPPLGETLGFHVEGLPKSRGIFHVHIQLSQTIITKKMGSCKQSVISRVDGWYAINDSGTVAFHQYIYDDG